MTLAYITVASFGVIGGLAVVLPKHFNVAARAVSIWVKAGPTLPVVDSRVDIDSFVLRHTRTFGSLVVLAAACCAALINQIP